MRTVKLKKTLLVLLLISISNQFGFAQQLVEKTNIRLYEHHSSTLTGKDFGFGADPSQSGYNFIDHEYVNSFDVSTFEAYAAGSTVPQKIDMVEHNGPFGSGGLFGFTSSESTIWSQNGPPFIRGNGLTEYHIAPTTFNYETATTHGEIKSKFDAAKGALKIQAVTQGNVYIAKLRGAEKYIAIKVTEVKNATTTSGEDDVYFTFNYKYAGSGTGISEDKFSNNISLYPNPSNSVLNLQFQKPVKSARLSIYNIAGQLQNQSIITNASNTKLNIEDLKTGVYYLQIVEEGSAYVSAIKFVKM